MPDAAPPKLWTPSPERVERAQLTTFARDHGLPEDYGELWRWSVDDIERFWLTFWLAITALGFVALVRCRRRRDLHCFA